MAIVNGYCDVQDLRDQLSDGSTKLPDALLERAISAASRAVDKYCGRRFWQDVGTSARLYCAVSRGQVDTYDISSKEGLILETDRSNTGNWEVIDPDKYILLPLNADADGGAYAWDVLGLTGWATPGFPFTLGAPNVRVTARWGWSEIPDEVVEATIIKAVALFKRKDAPFGIAGFSEFGPVRIGRTDPEVMSLLQPYRKMVIA